FVSRKLSSMVNRRPYSLTISVAVLLVWLVARHHASFIRGAFTQTTAGTRYFRLVTAGSGRRRGRPPSGTHAFARWASVLRQVVISVAIFPTVTTIDDRFNRDCRPSCMIQPWPPCLWASSERCARLSTP